MGGPRTPAIGWAGGIERLSMLLDATPAAPRPVAVVPMGEGAMGAAILLLQALRAGGVRAEIAYRGNTKKRLERANRIGATHAVLIGEDEVARGVAQVKALDDGSQAELALDAVTPYLAGLAG